MNEISLNIYGIGHKKSRKPLVLRGARQVGKTTLAKSFLEKFEQYLYLNLELAADRKPFDDFTNLNILIQTLFLDKNIAYKKEKTTLLFIDEIQEVPEALNILRYFYEEEPGTHVIAAESLLESLFDRNISFPVGRVEYMVVPIEVKSGATGTLRSLHLYMDLAPHNIAIRFCAAKQGITQIMTASGKVYYLLTLPYFLATKLNEYLVWFEEEIKSRS